MFNLNIIVLNTNLFFLLKITPNSLMSLLKYKVSLVVYNKLNNSAFIIDTITIFYLFTFQIINPPKRRIAYPCKLFRLLILSAKEASVTVFNSSPPPNLNPNIQVLNKQLITLFAAYI